MKRGLIILLMFLTLPLHAQQATDIHLQFDRWKEMCPRVMPFAVLNQHKFMPGDSIFLKLYFLTENLHRVEGRRILHLTLVNNLGVSCGSADFGIRDGEGFNQFVLPDSLSEGFYRLVFRNEWMEQYQPSESFQEEIAVVTGKAFKHRHGGEVSFFAEGGNFVAGIANKIVIKGSPDLKGDLIDQEGTVLTTYRLNDAGIGFVMFTPQTDRKYKLRSLESTVDLPAFNKDGLSILVNAGQKGFIRSLLAAPAASPLCAEDLFVLLTSQGGVYYSLRVKLGVNGYASIQIPDKDLPHGPALLSVISSSGKPLAVRHVFIKKPQPFTSGIKFESALVHERDRLNVTLDIHDSSGIVQQAQFLALAMNSIVQNSEPVTSFEDEISLALHGLDVVEFRKHSDDPASLDLWMITQRMPVVPWEKIVSGQFAEPAPMNTLLHKVGHVFMQGTHTPVPVSTRLSVLLQKELVNYEVTTGAEGVIDLPFLIDFWGDEEMLYRAEYEGMELSDVALDWQRDTTRFLPASGHQLLSDEDPYVTYNVKRRLIQRSYFFYSSEQGKGTVDSDPNAIIEDEFSGADITVNVQDYIVFPDMVEMIREIIPSLRHRKQKGKSIVRVLYSDHTQLTTGDPLYVIDGIITNNTEFFLGLKPSDLISVKLVTDISKLKRFGSMSSNGVVLVHTRGIDLTPLEKVNNSVPLRGLTREVPWRVPGHHSKGTRIPDFRTTLLWAPMMTSKPSSATNVFFEASDDLGPIKIVVKGFTSSGQPFSATAIATVEFKEN